MRIGPGAAALALTAVLQSAAVSAQPLSCPLCRAVMPFPVCDNAAIDHPPQGAIVVVGTVARIEDVRCGVGLTVDVRRSSSSSLPARIRADGGPCLTWNGQTGDVISTVVSDTPLEGGVYQV